MAVVPQSQMQPLRLAQRVQILVIWRKKNQFFKHAEFFTELCHRNLTLLLCALGYTLGYRGNICGEGGNTHTKMEGKLCPGPHLGPDGWQWCGS